MGDIADHIIDEGMWDEDQWGEYDDIELDSFSHSKPVSYKMCKYCNKTGLIWGNTDKGWRLFDGSNQHKCGK